MFGALNRFISRLDSDGPSPNSSDTHGAYGFQVLRNKNADIAIEPWYDFIIGINGRPVDTPSPPLLAAEIRNCASTTVALTLYSAKGSHTRTLHLPVPSPSPTLGLTLQWCPLALTHHTWHILSVTPSSPADTAGLLPYSDYIVGTPEGHVHGESGLGELVEDYLSRPLRLYVYNHEYAVTRLVTITPSRSWGGEGALGCVLGFGALHRLPAPLGEPPQGPGETMFETAGSPFVTGGAAAKEEAAGGLGLGLPPNLSSQPPSYQSTPLMPSSEGFLVPARFANAAPPPPMGAVGKKAGRARKGGSPGRGFEDVFREGEERSREVEGPGGAGKKMVSPPPPPPGGRTTGGVTEQAVLEGEPGGEEGEGEGEEKMKEG